MENQYTYKYPHPAVTADCVVFGYDDKEKDKDRRLKVLLIKRGEVADGEDGACVGQWALPGGFLDVENDESIAHTAARELKEETNLVLPVGEFREFGSFSDIGRDSRERVITIAHYALVKPEVVQGGTDAERAEWFPVKDFSMVLAFDHNEILNRALFHLKRAIHFEPIGFELLPEIFTLPQLQKLYESILDVEFDRRNFANKMKHYDILIQVEEDRHQTSTRIPIKYSFNKKVYDNFKAGLDRDGNKTGNGFHLEF